MLNSLYTTAAIGIVFVWTKITLTARQESFDFEQKSQNLPNN